MPGKLPFELQREESVLVDIRRHWAFFLPKLAGYVLLAIIPAAVLLFFTQHLFAWLGAAAWILVVAVRAYFLWYRYQNDRWIITNQRVVDSIRRHWFHHSMSSADLIDVEDMSIRREGVLATTMNFGDVHLQTAGAQSKFVLSGVPDPAKVLATVDAARDQARVHNLQRGCAT